MSDIVKMKHGLLYLHSVLQDERLCQLHVLVLANKCDLLREDFLDATDIAHYLKLTDFLLSETVSSHRRILVG